MDVFDETHIIHSCYAAGWENISAIFLGVKKTFEFSNGRKLCDDMQALSVPVNFKLIVRCF